MLCRPISSERSEGAASFSLAAFSFSLGAFSATVDLDQMGDDPNLTLELRGVLALDALTDPPEAEGLQGPFLTRVGPVGGANLPDRHGAHDCSSAFSSAGASSAASSAAGISASAC